MAHKNQGIFTGELMEKDTKTKDGRVWGWMFKVGQIGEAVEFNVGEGRFHMAEVGEEIGIRFKITQKGFKLYTNVIEVETAKQQKLSDQKA